MDELLVAFIDNNYTDELAHEFYRSFSLLEQFEVANIYSGFIDIVIEHASDCSSAWVQQIHQQLDTVLDHHSIQLTDETSISQKNEVLTALLAVQDLEDYNPIISILESSEDPDLQLATIISDLSSLEISDVLEILTDFDVSILAILRQYVTTVVDDTVPVSQTIINNLRVFKQALGSDNLGILLVTNGMVVGESFETYLPFIDELTTGSIDQVALNILSVIYLTPDGVTNPIQLYRKHSLELLSDLNLVSKVEVKILDYIAIVTDATNAIRQQVPA